MVISATAKFLVRNMVTGKITYLEVAANTTLLQKFPTLMQQIDAYIVEQGLEDVIDKTK